MRSRLVLLLAASLATAVATAGQEQQIVRSRLVGERHEIAPGAAVTLALEQVIPAGWHTFWSNPGEVGLPTEIRWQLPPGWTAGDIEWPYPQRLYSLGMVTYGYEGSVSLLANVTAPRDAVIGRTYEIRAAVSSLVCKDACIPQAAIHAISLAVRRFPREPDAKTRSVFADARERLPVRSPWPIRVSRDEGRELLVRLKDAPKFEAAEFFALREGLIDPRAAQTTSAAQAGLLVRLPLLRMVEPDEHISGVLRLTAHDGSTRAVAVEERVRATAPPGETTGVRSPLTMMTAVLLALLGGLILNLMPCVLPVLALKAFAIATHVDASRKVARQNGLAYGAGVILSCLAFGTLALVLSASAGALGWGFQLQQPAVVAFFAYFVFAIGLNFSGVIEIPGAVFGGRLPARQGIADAFTTGVMAVALAAPCTGPFMAAALGYALTQPPQVAAVIFVALGIGFAAPMFAASAVPGLGRLLPRPGRWMERLREALAFPMYATAAWLLWVLVQEVGTGALASALAGMITLAIGAWAWRSSRDAGTRWRRYGATLAAAALVITLATLGFLPAALPAPSSEPLQPLALRYSPSSVQDFRAQGRGVFINVTAAWCITCRFNERNALSRATIRRAFAEKEIAYLVADWTRGDREISALLRTHERAGVPLYLYYPPRASEPQVLPQFLSVGAVLNALEEPTDDRDEDL